MKILEQHEIDQISAELSLGEIVAVPTETVYGLAAKHDNPLAIARLITIKKRQPHSGKVFTLMLADTGQISEFATENDISKRLANEHFPGELTMVLSKNPEFHNPYFDEFDSIGIRVPNHDFMIKLLQRTGPLLVTSANLPGDTPAIKSETVIRDLDGVDICVLGRAGEKLPSTVVDLTDGKISILRQGELRII